MTTIATLGPPGTFSDIAAHQYVAALGDPQALEIRYYKSIKSAFMAIGSECDCGVLPIENLSEGFVQVLLDLLLDGELQIIHELYLPIRFSFVSLAREISAVRKIFVQFMAKGQCITFIEGFQDVKIENTESNIQSLDLMLLEPEVAGAIVPFHSVQGKSFPIHMDNVGDYRNNSTRFIALAPDACSPHLSPAPAGKTAPAIESQALDSKTSLIVLDDQDYPGLLVQILSAFSKRNINLRSIMSRPTREYIGKYHFFIDIEGHRDAEHVKAALGEISQLNKVKILGSYAAAKQM